MQSRLEEEEEAKAALMSRIQRLTKLILVSTKNTIPGLTDVPGHQPSHSVGEDDVSSFPICFVHKSTVCYLLLLPNSKLALEFEYLNMNDILSGL